MEKTAVIIPALNEASHIGPLVRETAALPVDWVIVVDNGSTDDTAGRAAAAGAIVISEPRRGYGFACAAGTAAAAERGAAILVYMDGDYSAVPAELPRLLTPIQRRQADLALGSRLLGHVSAGAMPPHQRLGNRLTAWLMRRLYGVRVTDLAPFRAIRTELLLSLQMQEMTYGWPTEMMVKVARRHGRLAEVPVSWQVRRSGRSKISGTWRGSFLAAYHILRVTLRYARK